MTEISIPELRILGLTEMKGRIEMARLGVKLRGPIGTPDPRDFLAALRSRMAEVLGVVQDEGGEIVPNSFSLTGQSFLALVPLDHLEVLSDKLEEKRAELFVDREGTLGPG